MMTSAASSMFSLYQVAWAAEQGSASKTAASGSILGVVLSMAMPSR